MTATNATVDMLLKGTVMKPVLAVAKTNINIMVFIMHCQYVTIIHYCTDSH